MLCQYSVTFLRQKKPVTKYLTNVEYHQIVSKKALVFCLWCTLTQRSCQIWKNIFVHMTLSFVCTLKKTITQKKNFSVSLVETETKSVKAVHQHWLRAVVGPTIRRTRQKVTVSHESYAAIS